MQDWLEQIGAASPVRMAPASADASFRRYFRFRDGDKSFIAMDAPPPQEDCRPFVRIAGYLEAMQLNAPRVVDADIERGYLLLTDLGSSLYLQQLETDPGSSDRLYDDAIKALLTLQENGCAYQAMLPDYDADLLSVELSLFHDWLCETHIGMQFSPDDEMAWRDVCSVLIRNALDQPQVFVHRDYHSRNLMVTEKQNPGILDFQDAVEGPLTYDLVSLLKDCYIQWPAERVRDWAMTFFNASDDAVAGLDRDQFLRYFELMGAQRHLKAAGIFARLNHRDGKTGYLDDIPRTLSYILELAPRYAELGFLADLIQTSVMPAFEDGR